MQEFKAKDKFIYQWSVHMMLSGRILQLGLLLVVLSEYKHWHHIQHIQLLVVGNQPAETNKLVKKQSHTIQFVRNQTVKITI